MAIQNFAQSFGTGSGAHFFYFSTQITNQVRKNLCKERLRNYGFLPNYVELVRCDWDQHFLKGLVIPDQTFFVFIFKR
jgi:hypothetical protein